MEFEANKFKAKAFYGALAVHKFLHLQKRFLAIENELNYGDIAKDEREDPVENVSEPKKEVEHESWPMFAVNSSNIFDKDAHAKATKIYKEEFVEEGLEKVPYEVFKEVSMHGDEEIL